MERVLRQAVAESKDGKVSGVDCISVKTPSAANGIPHLSLKEVIALDVASISISAWTRPGFPNALRRSDQARQCLNPASAKLISHESILQGEGNKSLWGLRLQRDQYSCDLRLKGKKLGVAFECSVTLTMGQSDIFSSIKFPRDSPLTMSTPHN